MGKKFQKTRQSACKDDIAHLLNLGGEASIYPGSDVTVGTQLIVIYSGSETVAFGWNKDGVAMPGVAGNIAYSPGI